MNKRDALFSLIDPNARPSYIPAAFFLHFPPQFHRAPAAVSKHLEFFRATDMDFVKIQYEHNFPRIPAIQRPEDWAKMPFYNLDFYEPPLRVVEGLVKEAKKEALIILTLYSPFMCAGHTVGMDLLCEHIRQNPLAVMRGLQVITESLMGFVRECIHLGLDGFYTSTQGGEAGRFDDPVLFDQCVRPYDLALMAEINHSCLFNILHICDYHLPYRDLRPFLNYPGQVVNCSLELTEGEITAKEVAQMFNRPYMGGLNRHGIIATGSKEEIRAAVEKVCQEAPERFILGADCTLPSDTDWSNIRTAVDTAHAFSRAAST